MIKPEDVPESLVYDVYAQMKKCLELDELGMPVSTQQQIADLLNLCVEAGVVSPPVRILRDNFGVLEKSVLYVDDNEAQSHASPQGRSEHWKGQTT